MDVAKVAVLATWKLTDPDFSIIWLSDPHGDFSSVSNWTVNNRVARGIQLLLCGGDIDTNWTAVDASIAPLVNNAMPFNIAPGNHDYPFGNPIYPRDLTTWNTHAGASVVTDSVFFEEGRAENAYRIFTVGSQSFIAFTLETGPRQAVIDWVNTTLTANASKLAIINTHSFLLDNGTRVTTGSPDNPHNYFGAHPDCHDGEELWQECIKLHSNVFLVMNGHHISYDSLALKVDTGDNGNTVNQMCWSWHTADDWTFRVLSFWLKQRAILVETGNAWTGTFITDADNKFWMRY